MVRSPIAKPTAGVDRTHREGADRPPRRTSTSPPRRDVALRRFRRRSPTTFRSDGVGFERRVTKQLKTPRLLFNGSMGAPAVQLAVA
jgi:hypothetical protein